MRNKLKWIVITCILIVVYCFCGCDPNEKWSYQFTKTNANNVESIGLLKYCGEDGETPDGEDSIEIRGKYFIEIESLDKIKYSEFLYDLSKYSVHAEAKTEEEESAPPLQYLLRILYVDGSSFYWFWGMELYRFVNPFYDIDTTNYKFAGEVMEFSSTGTCVLQKRTYYLDYYAVVIGNYFSTKLIGEKELKEANDAYHHS